MLDFWGVCWIGRLDNYIGWIWLDYVGFGWLQLPEFNIPWCTAWFQPLI